MVPAPLPSKLTILLYLSRYTTGRSQADIRRMTGLSRVRVKDNLTHLERDGCITVTTDQLASGKKINRTTITEKGLTRLDAWEQERQGNY